MSDLELLLNTEGVDGTVLSIDGLKPGLTAGLAYLYLPVELPQWLI